MDVPGLRRHALEEIRRFEEQARSSGVSNEVVLAARYALCAGLDEAVLSTPWGNQSEWAQHPLLVALHREAWGGEKFFEMLDRISQDPSRYIDLMELQYLVSRLRLRREVPGAGARARAAPRDPAGPLPQDSRASRPGRVRIVAALARIGGSAQSAHFGIVPWWVVAAAALPILAIAFTVYYAGLASVADPVHAELAKVGLEDFAPPRQPVPVRGPDAETAPGGRRTGRRPQRGGARQPDEGHAAPTRRSVPVRQRDGQPGVRRDVAAR